MAGTIHNSRDLFVEKEGFSTIGMVLALLITISLIMSAARVYEINTASAEIQEVADASALAAENMVAEYYLVALICDAVVFSLSLGMLLSLGLGVIASCVPMTAPAGKALLEASSSLKKARDSFSEKAQTSLIKFQEVLPFLASAKALQVMRSNSNGVYGANYQGVALLVPWTGEDPRQLETTSADAAYEDVHEQQHTLQTDAAKAEEEAAKLKTYKQQAFQHDSGSQSSYCMYERAYSLAGMKGSENPYFSSVDTWSFSASLARAQAYYEHRYHAEAPQNNSVGEQANSALRKQFYAFASSELAKGYVRETPEQFDAYFPLLPKNTEEMRSTTLYTQVSYPITRSSDGVAHMHAWSGCPAIPGETADGSGSLSQMESQNMSVCDTCQFSASSLGSVAAASSNIENGFEFHYLKVAEAAQQYEEAFQSYQPLASQVRNRADALFESLLSGLSETFDNRIEVAPPGRFGAIVLVVDSSSAATPFQGTTSLFVQDNGFSSPRAAISAATLVKENSDEGKNALTSFFDGYKDLDIQGVSLFAQGAQVIVELWSGVLDVYISGHEGISTTLESSLDALPLASESGLGTWAAEKFQELVDTLGFEPPDLSAPKAVNVNSVHVLSADSSAFSERMLQLKAHVLSSSSAETNLFGAALSAVESQALQAVEDLSQEFVIATVELFDGAVSIPLTLSLPEFVTEEVNSLLLAGFTSLKGLVVQATGGRQWR